MILSLGFRDFFPISDLSQTLPTLYTSHPSTMTYMNLSILFHHLETFTAENSFLSLARRKSEISRADDTGTEASSSPATQPTQPVAARGGSSSIPSHASPYGSASFEGQQLAFSPPLAAGQRPRGEAPAQRFTGHGSHGDGNAPIGFMLNRGPPSDSRQHRNSFASSPGYLDGSPRDGIVSEAGAWSPGEVQPQLQISYLLGDSPSTQAGSTQYERTDSFSLEADGRANPVDPEHCGFTGRQAYLYRTYIMRIAPSVSINSFPRPDPKQILTTSSP